MASLNPPIVLTANDLRSGEVVYWSSRLGWQVEIGCADIFTDITAAETQLRKQNEPLAIVGPYLVSVRNEGDEVVPVRYRESLRMAGPSNYFHGKQASQ